MGQTLNKSVKTPRSYQNWTNSYEKIKAYYNETEQRLIVPQSEDQLVSWMAVNRTKYRNGKLSQEQIDKLNAIHFLWAKPSESKWETNYQILKQIYDETGNANVGRMHKAKNGKNIGMWLHYQKQSQSNGTLSEERKRKLDELKISWTPYEEHWNETYAQLEEVYHDGKFTIPATKNTLRGWLDRQKKLKAKGKLTSEQVEKLAKYSL